MSRRDRRYGIAVQKLEGHLVLQPIGNDSEYLEKLISKSALKPTGYHLRMYQLYQPVYIAFCVELLTEKCAITGPCVKETFLCEQTEVVYVLFSVPSLSQPSYRSVQISSRYNVTVIHNVYHTTTMMMMPRTISLLFIFLHINVGGSQHHFYCI